MLLPDEGTRVEEHVRRLAGVLGVPDFVYRPSIVTTGSGTRETGDALLVAGDQGLVVQVKSRDPTAALGDDLAKAKRWCLKEGAKARRQGTGTRRHLSGSSVSAVSLRGQTRRLPDPADWPIVVVIDHSANPIVAFPPSPDTIYLSLHDWLGLHVMIRSTIGLISYVRRAIRSDLSIPLGQESRRYQQLAAADFRWANLSSTAVPLLPTAPLTGEDLFAADLYGELIEKVADETNVGWDPENYLLFVEVLDQAPTLARVQLGRKMIHTFQEMVQRRSRRSFLTMNPESAAKLAVLYDYDDGSFPDPDGRYQRARIAAYTTLRHTHGIDAGLDPEAPTLGVGIQHRPEEGRRYAFALSKGAPPELPPEVRTSLESEFGVFDGKEIVAPTQANKGL